jgi:hypothetical protein
MFVIHVKIMFRRLGVQSSQNLYVYMFIYAYIIMTLRDIKTVLLRRD